MTVTRTSRSAPKLGLGHCRYGLALAVMLAGGCSCDEDIINPNPPDGTCDLATDCADLTFRHGECRQSRCLIDGDCCPGQVCNAAAGFCADQTVACTRDADCDVPDQRCIQSRGGSFCGYPNAGNVINEYGTQSCASTSDCPVGRSCFAKRCVAVAPCEGACPSGTVCDIDSDSCYAPRTPGPDDPASTEDSCLQSCGEGQMLVLKDQDTMSGPICCAIECECKTLPPIQPGQYGWYASIAVSDDAIRVSAYDPGYGDLVVASFDEQGNQTALDYVDGLPTAGDIVGDPNGPRAGRADPGSDVGEHTSIAIGADGNLHVAYYDLDQGALKYASYAAGQWKTSVVDDEGDTGLYTSIAIGPDGNPRIAYMMADGTVGGNPTKMSALKLATASVNLPSSSSDWTTEVVDQRIKPEPICGGGCPQGRACVDLGGGASCQVTTVGCNMCGSDQACVDVSGTPECQDKISAAPFDDLVEGTGLFASLVLTSTGSPMIAYYDRVARDLRWAYRSGAGFTVATLDGNDSMNPTDAGQHASLALALDGSPAVVYVDASEDLLYYMDIRSRTKEVIDTGVAPPNARLVGADAALIFDATGTAGVAYQDATNLDLLYARRLGSPPMWSTEVLRGAAPAGTTMGTASGFYVSQRLRGQTAFISNLDVTFSPDGELLLKLSVVSKTLN